MNALFQQCRIGTMELRNRFVRSATNESMAEDNGAPTDALVELYRRLSRGEVGLIISGFAYVRPRGKAVKGQLGAWDDSLIPALSRMARAVHDEGGRIALQIVHAGAQGHVDLGQPREAPSAVEDRANGSMPEAMPIETIRSVVEDFAQAARRAREADFDAVQVHAAHGYLFSSFLSPYCNRRDDEYGGPIENRARIVFETCEAIRERAGSDFPLLIKINCEDFDGAGLQSEDSLWVCRELERRGIDAIELSGGVPAAKLNGPVRARIDRPEREAYFRDHARRFSKQLKRPLMLVGGLRSIDH